MKQQRIVNYAVPAMAEFIKDQWADEIAVLLETTPESVRNDDFDLFTVPLTSVRIELMDGSFADFRSACFLVSRKKRAIAVLTEHCGYHIFPIHEAKIYCNGNLTHQQTGADYP